MRILHRFTFSVSYYRARNATAFRRAYWACIILLVIAVFAIPITLSVRNPHVRLPDFHGPPTDLMLEWNRMVLQARRDQSNISDFVFMIDHLSTNYPFIHLIKERLGIDYMELAFEVYDDFLEVVRYQISPGHLSDFFYERYLSLLGGFGRVHISSDPRGDVIHHRVEPYYMGHYDWRFTDDRLELEVRAENFTTQTLAQGVAHMDVNSFLAKGYEPITWVPFWYYDFDTELQRVLEFYSSVAEYEHLVIDIRGIGSGFSQYFLPMILEPNINYDMTAHFYAFHSDGPFANRVSRYFRTWYGIGDVAPAAIAFPLANVSYFRHLVHGFPVYLNASPTGREDTFSGQIWLLTDSGSFSGANNMYLQMALDAGFNIIYEENPQAVGWGVSYIHLPHSRLSLRYNPLLFTDRYGRPLEVYGAQPTHQLNSTMNVLDLLR